MTRPLAKAPSCRAGRAWWRNGPVSMPCSLLPALLCALCMSWCLVPGARADTAAGEGEGAALSVLRDAEYVAPDYAEMATDLPPYTGFGTSPDAPALVTLSAPQKASSGGTAKKRLDELSTLLEASPAKGSAKKGTRENLRPRVLRETGFTLAFQQGVRYRAGTINKALESRAQVLDRLFNFQPLLIAGRVLPPVIVQAGPVTTLEGERAAHHVEMACRITRQARVVSAAPTWRDYLVTSYAAFEVRPELLPRDDTERAIWREAVLAGWDEGTMQAEEMFRLNMARLVTDYRGMLRFTGLARLGLVRLPGLAKGHMAMSVGPDTLDINQTWFRITVPASFRDPDTRDGDGPGKRRPAP